MAFRKAITDPNTGVTANYWRAGSILIDPVSACGKIMLLGYTSEEIRRGESGRNVAERAFFLAPDAFSAIAATPVVEGETIWQALAGAIYRHIRAVTYAVPGDPTPRPSEFVDAEDV